MSAFHPTHLLKTPHHEDPVPVLLDHGRLYTHAEWESRSEASYAYDGEWVYLNGEKISFELVPVDWSEPDEKTKL